jgi:hypothetical protein
MGKIFLIFGNSSSSGQNSPKIIFQFGITKNYAYLLPLLPAMSAIKNTPPQLPTTAPIAKPNQNIISPPLHCLPQQL